MIKQCDTCTYSKLCKYKDTYEKTMTAIKTKEEDPLSISIDCKYYNGKYYSLCDINK